MDIMEQVTRTIELASKINAGFDRYREFSKRKQVDDIHKLLDHAIKDLTQAANLIEGWKANGNVR